MAGNIYPQGENPLHPLYKQRMGKKIKIPHFIQSPMAQLSILVIGIGLFTVGTGAMIWAVKPKQRIDLSLSE